MQDWGVGEKLAIGSTQYRRPIVLEEISGLPHSTRIWLFWMVVEMASQWDFNTKRDLYSLGDLYEGDVEIVKESKVCDMSNKHYLLSDWPKLKCV